MERLLVAGRKGYVRVDLKRARPDDAELRRLLIGPSGKLRAPVLKMGKTVVVGFNEAMYQEVLG